MTINWNSLPHYILKWWYRKWHIEKDFQKEFIWKLRKDWFISYHPPDIWQAYRYLDCHLTSPEWELWWAELKKIEWATFNCSHFEESQVILLRDLDKRNPDIARVFIYSVRHNDYKMFTFTKLWNMKNSKWWCKIF